MDRLKKVYLEPTTRCNLNCRICIHHSWDEPHGDMSWQTFHKLLKELALFPETQTMSFAGFGEPLLHPQIVEMIHCAHERDIRTEVTSNALLLTPVLADELIRASLDQFIVSIDGSDDAYGDVRNDASLQEVVSNVKYLRRLGARGKMRSVTIGIAFVAMKRTIHDLPKVYEMAAGMGASKVFVTNVFPYTRELAGEMLYHVGPAAPSDMIGCRPPAVTLPGTKATAETMGQPRAVLQTESAPCFWDRGIRPHRCREYCPFIESGSLSVAWNGRISPCLPLLHSYTSYARGREKRIASHHVGCLSDRSLSSVWDDIAYAAFRRRVREFDFPPCPECDCPWTDTNDMDCLGNPFPVCGDCLWAQGLIRCP
jgi:MoaA/NifB/PqqE/SkfB family radical SAM enzyme